MLVYRLSTRWATPTRFQVRILGMPILVLLTVLFVLERKWPNGIRRCLFNNAFHEQGFVRPLISNIYLKTLRLEDRS